MELSKNKPIALSVEHHLKEFIDLPYPPNTLDSLVLFCDGSLFYPFHKILSQDSRPDYTSSDVFGIGEIQFNAGFRVKNYLLPIEFAAEKSFAREERSFQLQTQCHDDLICSLKGPLLPDPFICHNYLFAFDLKTKQWNRIGELGADGTYQKQPLLQAGQQKNYPLENPKHAFRSAFGKLIVWSPEPGKLRVELDDTAEDQYGDRIIEESFEVKAFYREKFQCEKRLNAQNMSAWGLDPLTLDQYTPTGLEDSWSTVVFYTITGIERLFNRRAPTFHENLEQKDVVISAQRAIKMKRGKKGVVGIFAKYSLPGEWHRGVFLVFEYDE